MGGHTKERDQDDLSMGGRVGGATRTRRNPGRATATSSNVRAKHERAENVPLRPRKRLGGSGATVQLTICGCASMRFGSALMHRGWSSHRDAFTRDFFGAGSGLNAMTLARTVTSTSKVAAMSAHASSNRSL